MVSYTVKRIEDLKFVGKTDKNQETIIASGDNTCFLPVEIVDYQGLNNFSASLLLTCIEMDLQISYESWSLDFKPSLKSSVNLFTDKPVGKTIDSGNRWV